MPSTLESVTIEEKARDLCEFVVELDDYQTAWKNIETFLEDDQAKEAYRSWQEKGAELHQKGHQGLEPSETEVEELEKLKQAVMDNPVALNFVNAEGQMNTIFATVTKLLQKTLQTGKVPTEEEMAAGECCGNSGCGCH